MFSVKITIFEKATLKPSMYDAEGSRTAVVDVINKLLKDNEGKIHNIIFNVTETEKK